MLRSHTSALVPGALRALAAEKEPKVEGGRDVLLVCPGIVYRRDSIDRLHSGTPHQLDVWRITSDRALGTGDLKEMIDIVVHAALPGAEYRVEAREHPYTTEGLQIDVENGDEWVEIGECGLAAPDVLTRAGVAGSGLAMGLGLDRILMLRKGIADIRLLRSADPRIAGQMRDVGLYRPVSNRPPVVRDLSIAVPEGDAAEELGDRVRAALVDDTGGDRRDTGGDTDAVEEVAILSETAHADLPPIARNGSVCVPARRTCSCESCCGIRPGRSLAKTRTGSATRSSTHCTAARRPGRRGSGAQRRGFSTVRFQRSKSSDSAASPSRIS